MSEVTRYICFNLGVEEFAIPLLAVKEVIGLPEVTPVPQTPPHFLGIMNLRGSVISIMDLRNKLGAKSIPSDETTVVILDLGGGHNIGVVVDRVNSVLSMEADKISEKPVVDSAKSTEYITGVYRRDSSLVLLLDVARVLSVEDRNGVFKRQSSIAA
jgi:purine-binding chemotaxis protein CheW